MKQLVKVGMALVMPIITMMVLLTPVASAHTAFRHDHIAHELSSTKCFSKRCHAASNSSWTEEGWVGPGEHTRVAYCQRGSRVVGGSWILIGPFKFIHFGPTPRYDGAQLDFESYGSTHYIVTANCYP
jgi:hypothetical protein